MRSPPPAVQFISCSSPTPPPMPRLSHNKAYLSMPSACLDSSLPPSPLPPFPLPAVQFMSCSSPSPPHAPSIPAPAVQFISCSSHPPHALSSGSVHLMLLPPPPCPVYLLIIVFKHAQCMPRSVLAPIAPPALPAPSGSVHLMLLPPPRMPRLSHNKGYLSMPTACLDPSLPPLPLPPFPPPAVQFISCSSLPPHAPSIS